MRCLHIQLQPELCNCDDPSKLADGLKSIATVHPATKKVEVVFGEDDGPYININIDTTDPTSLWSLLHDAIANDVSLSSCAIACCEGATGWDDYFLLFHFDKTEATDVMT